MPSKAGSGGGVAFRPKHAVLQRPGAKRPLRIAEMPPWHSWSVRSEPARIIRFVESKLVQPVGVGAGAPMRVARFQRRLIRQICDSLLTFISIPAGNGKTTLMAAFALERVCRGDDYVEVDVLATKQEQAGRLIQTCIRMVESSPGLPELFEFYRDDGLLQYKPTGSTIRAHPAKLSAIQGLNSSLALVDEIGEVPGELVTSMIARIGKREQQRVVGFGTPGFNSESMLEHCRRMSRAGELPPGMSFVEFCAEAGCAIDDPREQAAANPAIRAGFLDGRSLALKAAVMPEHEFRAYHLGQPVESALGPWLPAGAWDDCPSQEPPPDGAQVVLALWGSYKRQVALVGSSMDGGVFFGWQAEQASDDEIRDAVAKACDQWDVVELCPKPHIRLGLMGRLEDDGVNVVPWPGDRATDVESTGAFYQAIVGGEIAHDHDPGLAVQVAGLTASTDRQGMPRLVDSAEQGAGAALAARAAFWRARQLADEVITDDRFVW